MEAGAERQHVYIVLEGGFYAFPFLWKSLAPEEWLTAAMGCHSPGHILIDGAANYSDSRKVYT